MKASPTAIIADDEPLLRSDLASALGRLWPELTVVSQARNGRAAIDAFERHLPDVCFLDVHMPGVSGIDAARAIGRRAQVVFVTAFDQYAVEAFTQGALDYLVKPVEAVRLQATVHRLRERLASAAPSTDLAGLLDQLETRLQRRITTPPTLRWLRASIGDKVRMIPVDEIDYLRSDHKYTRIAWRDDGGQPGEALIGMSLREVIEQFDATQFVQIHRSVIVNLASVSHVVRRANEMADVHLKGRPEILPVSRTYLHLFRQM